MEETVRYQYKSDGYSVITIDRAEKRNAISNQVAQDMKQAIQRALKDKCKFLIVTGAGEKMFCSGGDLRELHGDLTPDAAYEHLNQMKEILYSIVSFPVPTVCLLNGNALGGGCELASACDFRIAKEDTSFGFVQTTLGIVPGWGGGALLYEKLFPSFAYQWLMEAEVYSDKFLQQKGWIHKVISNSDWNKVEEILAPYLSKSYEQMTALKGQYNDRMKLDDLYQKMNEEVRKCANLWDSVEHIEAVERFLNRK
ncbi:Enoyl-CoA hydratase/carnithine racemase [Oceanobacillus limi]|uniref:Enoyl-CoA hydratase/carnithine racemase n=1 Tax=Oceanobacillus limi TaxID=930131 RepID=A0A1I0DED9_9BACI|nr:enoyl-CoA hydratase/isomerase family protein [Oceanobacillus limi]SET30103.1 Enoyl-CoA hydratase/carnithine racemase [Oceanobacillus limi]